MKFTRPRFFSKNPTESTGFPFLCMIGLAASGPTRWGFIPTSLPEEVRCGVRVVEGSGPLLWDFVSTVRIRLNRLIEKGKNLDSDKITSEFERLVRVLLAEGRIEAGTLNAILSAHRKEMERKES